MSIVKRYIKLFQRRGDNLSNLIMTIMLYPFVWILFNNIYNKFNGWIIFFILFVSANFFMLFEGLLNKLLGSKNIKISSWVRLFCNFIILFLCTTFF